MSAIYDDVSGLPIERRTLSMQLFQARQRIGHMQQRAISIVPRSFVQQDWRDVQIYDPSRFMQQPPILRVKNNPAAGRQDDVTASRQLLDSLSFTPPESILPFDLKDRRDRHPRPLHDFMVGIKKSPPQPPRQLPPDGRLSGPH